MMRMDGCRWPTTRMVRAGGNDEEDGRAKATKMRMFRAGKNDV